VSRERARQYESTECSMCFVFSHCALAVTALCSRCDLVIFSLCSLIVLIPYCVLSQCSLTVLILCVSSPLCSHTVCVLTLFSHCVLSFSHCAHTVFSGATCHRMPSGSCQRRVRGTIKETAKDKDAAFSAFFEVRTHSQLTY
jgi:hypothetical protein